MDSEIRSTQVDGTSKTNGSWDHHLARHGVVVAAIIAAISGITAAFIGSKPAEVAHPPVPVVTPSPPVLSPEASHLQEQLLKETSDVLYALTEARKSLVTDGFEASKPYRAELKTASGQWQKNRAVMQLRAKRLLGDTVARALFIEDNRNLVVDDCNVLILRDDPARNTDCARRLQHQVTVLTVRQDATNANKPLPPLDPAVIIPEDFTATLKIANDLLSRLSLCRRPVATTASKPPAQSAIAARSQGMGQAESSVPANGTAQAKATTPDKTEPEETGCANRRDLEYSVNLRVNLLGVNQGRLQRLLETPSGKDNPPKP